MPTHHESAVHALSPTGVPSSRARTVSMTGVTGWYRAKPCSQPGMGAIGTNALLAYGRNVTRNEKPLAVSGVFANRPVVRGDNRVGSVPASAGAGRDPRLRHGAGRAVRVRPGARAGRPRRLPRAGRRFIVGRGEPARHHCRTDGSAPTFPGSSGAGE